MTEAIGVYSDQKRSIEYESILGYYKATFLDKTYIIENLLLVIIDLFDQDDSISIANEIRSKDSSIPILLLVNYPNSTNTKILKHVNGLGATRVLEYRDRFKASVLLNSQSLIHPEYPWKKHDIAIIVSVFDEEQRFQNILNQTKKLQGLIENSFINSSIYFVNDGSKDDTLNLLNKMVSSKNEEINIVEKSPLFSAHNLIVNTRKAGTYIEGIKNVDAEYIFFLDGDDSFIMEDVSKMINILQDGYYDFIVGTKDQTAEDRKPIRRLMSFVKRFLTKGLLPYGVKDSQTGLKGMRSSVAKTLLNNMHIQNGLAADLEMLYLAKKYRFRVLQLPVTCYDREGSHINIIKDSLMFIKAIFSIPKQNRGKI
ncbi:MAG: glycosyltransferase [Spirochaetaceae bacterium]